MGLTKKAPKKRVLFFTDRVFWPANDGHKVVLFNYCKGLADKFDAEVHVLTFLEPGQTAQALSVCPEFIESVTLAKKPARQTVILNLIRALLKGAAGGPIQCSIFRSKGAANQLRDLVGELEPTHVFFDLPRLSPYVDALREYSCGKVLYMEDTFSLRYQRQLKSINSLQKTGGVAGKYSASLKGCVAKLASLPVFQKIVLATEAKRMRKLELVAPQRFDFVVLVSPLERDRLAFDTGASNIIAVPLGVDSSFYAKGPYPTPRAKTLSFLGNMRNSANADSLRYIANEVLPLIGDVMLEVSGEVSEDLRQELEASEKVMFLGRVEDTREALRSASVFLAPIAYGTGIKTKILEAMAIGVPIVTNSVGNEGIGLVDGVDAFVADTAHEQAAAVRRLMEDRELAARLADSARRKAAEVFDWKKSLENFTALGFEPVSTDEGETDVA